MARVMKAIWVLVAAVACAVIFGIGVPLLWIWLASQVQPTVGQGTSMLAATLVIVGPLASYIALVAFAGRFRFSQRSASEPQRMAWMRSRDEIRQRARYTTTFEQIVLLAILLAGFGFEIWFFSLAKCPTAMC